MCEIIDNRSETRVTLYSNNKVYVYDGDPLKEQSYNKNVTFNYEISNFKFDKKINIKLKGQIIVYFSEAFYYFEDNKLKYISKLGVRRSIFFKHVVDQFSVNCHAYAILSAGTVYMTGYNTYGQFGIPIDPHFYRHNPVATGVKYINCEVRVTAIIKNDGTYLAGHLPYLCRTNKYQTSFKRFLEPMDKVIITPKDTIILIKSNILYSYGKQLIFDSNALYTWIRPLISLKDVTAVCFTEEDIYYEKANKLFKIVTADVNVSSELIYSNCNLISNRNTYTLLSTRCYIKTLLLVFKRYPALKLPKMLLIYIMKLVNNNLTYENGNLGSILNY